MSKTTAYIIIGLFNILAFPAVIYAIYTAVAVHQGIRQGDEAIPLDTGTYYLLLLSIFWIFTIIEIAGRKGNGKSVQHWAGPLVLGWFIGGLALANIIPYWLEQSLTDAGYIPCHDPAEISRVSRGESLIYQNRPCPAL
ncbi:MAG: hypothetical protein MI754_07170 [Chromatiales bacterium]|nr:hypothetical protein [Chromatiales bacterium]